MGCAGQERGLNQADRAFRRYEFECARGVFSGPEGSLYERVRRTGIELAEADADLAGRHCLALPLP